MTFTDLGLRRRAISDARSTETVDGVKRVGVAIPGDPSDPSVWSGIPVGVMRGLAAAGAEPVAIRAESSSALVRSSTFHLVSAAYLRPGRDPRAVVRRARAAAGASSALASAQSRAAPKAIRRAGDLDAVVQIGTGHHLATDIPIITYEDMTVLQIKAFGYVGWQLLSRRGFNARIATARRACEQAVACCVTSPWAAASVIRDHGVAPEKVHVVGIGRNHSAPEVGGRDWSEPRFLFVGMDWKRKNGDGVVRAFGRLRRERPDARLDVVGGHPPLAAPGVTGHGVLRLDVPEQHERLDRLFTQATCFVLPSHAEASAIAYVEAAAAELPSIGTNQGGCEFLIGDGGLIVDPQDDDALLDAMRRLCDPDTAARMGQAAKLRSELFTWTAVGRRLLGALGGAPAEPLDVAAVAA